MNRDEVVLPGFGRRENRKEVKGIAPVHSRPGYDIIALMMSSRTGFGGEVKPPASGVGEETWAGGVSRR